MIDVGRMVRNARKIVSDNSPVILTGVGIVGVIATGVLSAKAGYSAGYKMSNSDLENGYPTERKVRAKQVARMTWKLYLPSAVTGVGTIASIAAANKIGTNRAAALAAAYTITDKAFTEYKSKVVETIGEKKEQAVRDEIMKDRVKNDERPSLIVAENADVICYDAYTDRYFKSTMEKLKKAQNDTNYEILHNMYVSLSEFYARVGLEKTAFSDEVGWTSDHLLELHFTSCMTPDDKPALAFTFHAAPIRGFSSAHR